MEPVHEAAVMAAATKAMAMIARNMLDAAPAVTAEELVQGFELLAESHAAVFAALKEDGPPVPGLAGEGASEGRFAAGGPLPPGRRSRPTGREHTLSVGALRMLIEDQAWWREAVGDAAWEQAVVYWRRRLEGASEGDEEHPQG